MGIDSRNKLIHIILVSTASVPDSHALLHLLHEDLSREEPGYAQCEAEIIQLLP